MHYNFENHRSDFDALLRGNVS